MWLVRLCRARLCRASCASAAKSQADGSDDEESGVLDPRLGGRDGRSKSSRRHIPDGFCVECEDQPAAVSCNVCEVRGSSAVRNADT